MQGAGCEQSARVRIADLEVRLRGCAASARQTSRDRERLACLDEARREAASEVWLGGRDSNPDTVVQSHVSYRWTTSQSGITEWAYAS